MFVLNEELTCQEASSLTNNGSLWTQLRKHKITKKENVAHLGMCDNAIMACSVLEAHLKKANFHKQQIMPQTPQKSFQQNWTNPMDDKQIQFSECLFDEQ